MNLLGEVPSKIKMTLVSKSLPSNCETRKNRLIKYWISIDHPDDGLIFQAIYSLRVFFIFKSNVECQE